MKWDRISRTYAISMYLTEVLAAVSLLAFAITRDLTVGVLFLANLIISATFHIMLQNYALHKEMKGSQLPTTTTEAMGLLGDLDE